MFIINSELYTSAREQRKHTTHSTQLFVQLKCVEWIEQNGIAMKWDVLIRAYVNLHVFRCTLSLLVSAAWSLVWVERGCCVGAREHKRSFIPRVLFCRTFFGNESFQVTNDLNDCCCGGNNAAREHEMVCFIAVSVNLMYIAQFWAQSMPNKIKHYTSSANDCNFGECVFSFVTTSAWI